MQFELKAFRASDGVTIIRLSATDLAEATAQAERQGYRVIAGRKEVDWSLPFSSRSKFSVALFSQELLALLEAGLNLVETVELLSRKARQPETRKVLESLTRHLREGLPFSKALESMPAAFPSLYIATIRSAERTGDLPADKGDRLQLFSS